MSIKKYFDRISHINYLIQKKATGTPLQLARKLSISKRSVQEYIQQMKELGFPIKYSKSRTSYYYEKDGIMPKKLFFTELDKETQKKITGGCGVLSAVCSTIQNIECRNIAFALNIFDHSYSLE